MESMCYQFSSKSGADEHNAWSLERVFSDQNNHNRVVRWCCGQHSDVLDGFGASRFRRIDCISLVDSALTSVLALLFTK